MTRVKCANCGCIWDMYVMPSVTNIGHREILDNMMASHQTTCPGCGSNAYDVIGSPFIVSTTSTPQEERKNNGLR